MRVVDVIAKKRDGGALSREEIELFVNGVTRGTLPDYQASALLMAIGLAWLVGRSRARRYRREVILAQCTGAAPSRGTAD